MTETLTYAKERRSRISAATPEPMSAKLAIRVSNTTESGPPLLGSGEAAAVAVGLAVAVDVGLAVAVAVAVGLAVAVAVKRCSGGGLVNSFDLTTSASGGRLTPVFLRHGDGSEHQHGHQRQ